MGNSAFINLLPNFDKPLGFTKDAFMYKFAVTTHTRNRWLRLNSLIFGGFGGVLFFFGIFSGVLGSYITFSYMPWIYFSYGIWLLIRSIYVDFCGCPEDLPENLRYRHVLWRHGIQIPFGVLSGAICLTHRIFEPSGTPTEFMSVTLLTLILIWATKPVEYSFEELWMMNWVPPVRAVPRKRVESILHESMITNEN